MCTYLTEHVPLEASAKGAGGWLAVSEATVYFDHPVHLAAEHSLNVDLRTPAGGPAGRVAVELDGGSALALARAIVSTLASAPQGMLPAEVAAAAGLLAAGGWSAAPGPGAPTAPGTSGAPAGGVARVAS